MISQESMTTRVFVQSGDDQQDNGQLQQSLKIESLDSGAGTFVILSTDRFAFETDAEIDALANQLKSALLVDVLPGR